MPVLDSYAEVVAVGGDESDTDVVVEKELGTGAGSGSNRMLIFAVSYDGNDEAAGTATFDAGGGDEVALTQIGSVKYGGANRPGVIAWYLPGIRHSCLRYV